MADDIKFVIGVDDSDILTSIKNHQILEKRIEQLTKEYANLDKLQNTGRLSAQAYAKAVQKLDSDINQLSVALKKGGSAVNQLATGMNVSGKAARRNEIAFQQAGYQVQDFIVQVQGGTNPLIAFSQQGSQLAGFFAGPWGAMIGLGIAALSSLAMAFLSTGEDAERLQKNLDVVGDKLDDFEKKVKSAEDTVSSFAYAMAQVQSTQIEAAWSELGDATAGSFEAAFMAKFGRFLYQNLWSGFQSWSSVTGTLAGENFAAAFGTSASILNDELLEQIGRAVKEQNIAVLDSTIESLSAFSDLTIQGAQFLEYLIKVRDEANGFTGEIKSAAEELMLAKQHGEDISKLNLKLGIDEAQKVAELLAENMNISLQAALGIVGLARGAVMGGRGSDPRQFTYMDEFREQLQTKPTKKKTSSSKKSGTTPKDPAKELEKFMAQQEQANALQKQGIMLGEESVRVTELINKYKEAGVTLDLQRIQNLAEEEQRLQTLQYAHDSLTNALMSVVDGTQSVGQAFKGLIVDMLLEIYRQQVAKNFASTVLSLFGFANGGVFSNGSQVNAFADGGVVGGPTYFPMSGGQTGLMGEAGPEAIMPLKRGANGKLGVQMEGGGDTTVVNNFNISANGDESVKRIIQQQIPRISEATKAAVVDSKRRGGSFGGAFI